MQELRKQLDSLEQRMTALEAIVKDLSQAMSSISRQLAALRQRVNQTVQQQA
ncbi:MAG: hypothetical protein AAGB13_07365 [Cyanobacteria bacterium P01_F01_bin.33]